MPPREYSVELPTHSAGVLEWGPPDGELLIALHGFPDTAWTWRTVAPLLADAGYRVAAPFLRGYAPSGIPADRDYSVRALAADAIALHERLGGTATTALVGHDWGAIAASAVAGDKGSPYSRVALLAVPPLVYLSPTPETRGPWRGALLRQPFHSWYIGYNQVPGLAERNFDWLVRRLWKRWSPGYDAIDDLDRLARAVPDRAHATAVISYYRALRSRGGTRVASAPPRVPLLYLHGDRDGALDPRFFAVVEPRIAPPSRAALLPGVGHFLHLEQPDTVTRHLLDFLRAAD
ncbi:alpha/beta fold hydrolase [Cryptosporangium aurantiacum]|uniref:Pimeloyl-ACP methyl ester carboxylesterase n=1 Tax=Cryptosporangium aurantiacum TaxID=134849 RepID=A0A1M7RKK1_9ACTN|nr:alpha/beta fold hydrolase [Cryptosporangium aurantiacum]SHN46692.1 Pimeloyl-ACP methyl ester carboxylesterase [Cryptosporangium aurantiacum]